MRHNVSAPWITSLPWHIQLSGILSARSALPWSVPTEQIDDDPFLDRVEPRNSRRGDSYVSLDVRLTKGFRYGKNRSAAAFVELFNATNETDLTGYVTTGTGPGQPGQPTSGFDRRRVQLGLRFDF